MKSPICIDDSFLSFYLTPKRAGKTAHDNQASYGVLFYIDAVTAEKLKTTNVREN